MRFPSSSSSLYSLFGSSSSSSLIISNFIYTTSVPLRSLLSKKNKPYTTTTLGQRIIAEQQYHSLASLPYHRLQRIIPRISRYSLYYRTLSTSTVPPPSPGISAVPSSSSSSSSPPVVPPDTNNASLPFSPPVPLQQQQQQNSEESKKKRDGIGSKIVDYFVDHPWHFFGPLFLLILFYILRASKSTDNQDNLIKAIDELSLLHAREVTTIGRSNALTREQWLQIVDNTYRMVEELIDNLHHTKNDSSSRSNSGTFDISSLSIEKKLHLLQIRPSELQYIIEQVTGKPLNNSYMLQRGATGLALLRDNKLPIPRNNEEMNKYQEQEQQKQQEKNEPWDVLPSNGPIIGKNSMYNDPLVDVSELLSLYGTILGGRPEPPLPSPPSSSSSDSSSDKTDVPPSPEIPPSPLDVYASPLQRLAIYRSMLYRYNRIKEEKLQIPSLYSLPNTSLLKNDNEANMTTDTSKMFTLFEIMDILDLLDRTHQIPTRSRTGPIVQYPFRQYSLRPMSHGIQETIEDIKLKTVTHDHIKYVQSLIDSHQQYTAQHSSSSSLSTAVTNASVTQPTVNNIPVLSPLEVKKIVFVSRSVCAWGECYGAN